MKIRTQKINSQQFKESYVWQYEAYPFFTSVYMGSSVRQKNRYFIQWKQFVSYFHDGQMKAYLRKEEILPAGKKIISELISGDDGYLNSLKGVHADILKGIELCESQKDLSIISFEEFWTHVYRALSNATLVLFSFDFALGDYMERLQTKNRTDFLELSTMSVSGEPSFMTKAQIRLAQLMKEYPGNFNIVHKNFIKEFGWIRNSYKGSLNIDRKWLENFSHSISGGDSKNNKSNRLLAKPNLRLATQTAREAYMFRDDKKKLLMLSVIIMHKWLKKIGLEYGYKYNELRWLTVEEIKDLIKGEKSYIKKAKEYDKNKERIVITVSGRYEDVSLAQWDKIEACQPVKTQTEIKGMVASQGIARGKAKIVISIKRDSAKFNKGDILVASMTRPEYLPLMNKASAFVTDEGGVSCHAAIISREMKKPCIIGTKIATKVLCDGDLVEVDADKGIVKILKRAI